MRRALIGLGASMLGLSLLGAPAQAEPIAGTSVSLATVRFAPSSNALSEAAKTSLGKVRWRATAAAGLVITSYTKTSSSTAGATRAGKRRSEQRARKVYEQLNVTVPVTYRLYAAKTGWRAKNVVTVTATGFEATLGDCAAYTGVGQSGIRRLMGLTGDGSQDGLIASIALAPASGAAMSTGSGLDLLCGGPGADTLDVANLLSDPDGPGVDLMLGAGGADSVALVDGGVFHGGGGADALATLAAGVFNGAGGTDTLGTTTGGCSVLVETVPSGAVVCP